jgi:hypothetical protein
MSFFTVIEGEVVLVDDSGNAVDVVLDNSIYRLEARSSIVGQTAGAGSEKKVSVIDDVTTSTHKRMQVEADIKPGAQIITIVGGDPSLMVTDFLKNAGSEDMVVDGSSTSVVFSYSCDATCDIVISSIRFVFTATILNFDGSNFGKGGGSLSNGLLVQAVVNNGTAVTLATLKKNEDFLRLQGRTHTELGGANDVLFAAIEFGGRTLLKGGTSDLVKVTVQDNLTGGARDIKYLTATFYGVKEN